MTGALGRLRARTPLRVTLVVTLLALVAVALVATGVAATTTLRGYLLDRVDSQLQTTARPLIDRLENGPPVFGQGEGDAYALPSAFYIQLSRPDGGAVGQLRAPLRANQHPPSLPRLDAASAAARAGDPFTVPARGGGHRWRALVTPLSDGSGSLTVALSLEDVESTVGRLVVIEVVVGLVVLLLLAGLGYLAIRSSLHPLVEVERTAQTIAAGDLSGRVPERDPRTEVGRLSMALNSMLTQIEAAFGARASSEAAARASEERMRRFVADASHELRTPLTSIRGFAELYRQGAAADPAEAARVMRRIEDEADRMGLLVEDLLLLARLDQQRPLERRPVDLVDLAGRVVDDARAMAPGRRIDLELTHGNGALVVPGDEARLRQVLTNLVTNALTHTPAGTPVVVRVDNAERDGTAEAVVEVRDAGPGLAAKDAARVFERFYRADASRTRASGGTGLGLSIVAALVATHGGTVTLDTAPGQGAVFRVRLPLDSRSPARQD